MAEPLEIQVWSKEEKKTAFGSVVGGAASQEYKAAQEKTSCLHFDP